MMPIDAHGLSGPAADGFHHPQSEDELAAIVRFARRQGKQLRVRGSAHSVKAAIFVDPGFGNLDIMLDRYTGVAFDDERCRVTVQAGCHLGLDPRDPTRSSTWENSLLAQLDARGWALPDLGGVTHQTINGYANAYASYVTTFEEYQLQNYEGASTLFGQWTLAAWCTKLRELARAVASEANGQRAELRSLGERRRSLPPLTKRPRKMTLPDRVQEFYENLSTQREASLVGLEELFTADVRFRDPFRDTVGLEPFRELFARMFKQYRFVDFTDVVAEGDEGGFTLRYNMHLRMAVGPTFVTPMASIFRTRDGKVCELYDYYDFPSGLVSPLPLLASAYKKLVNRFFL